jgi:hypothetical protein
MLLSVDLGPWNRASTGAAATVQRGALPGDLGEADSHWIATTIQPGSEKCSDLRRSLCPRQHSNPRPSAPEAVERRNPYCVSDVDADEPPF